MSKVSVIGAGSWGTALAILLSKKWPLRLTSGLTERMKLWSSAEDKRAQI